MALESTCAPVPEPLTEEHVGATVALLLAVAHPIRLRVLLELNRDAPLAVGELQERFDVEQSALSHQLRTLREAHLIAGKRDGKRVLYRLVDHHVAHIIVDAINHAAEPRS